MQGDDIPALVGAYPTCDRCGGHDVRRDAWASWNHLTRAWDLGEIFDETFCAGCDAPCGLVWRLDTAFRRKRIRRLNDRVRQGDMTHATVLVTQGVQAWGESFVRRVAEAVIAFDSFTPDNDPHEEHDFGALEIGDRKLVWKIDCFDRALTAPSPDPANPDVTHRVLTIMLASEY